MGLTYVIPDIIKSYLSWRKIQKCFKSTSRTAFKDSNSLDPFVLFTLLATVSYTSDSPLQLVSGFTIIAIHWSVSPTSTLVLDKLLFLQILYLILKPSIAAAVKVFNISKITSFISKYQESIHSIQEIGWSLLGSGLSSGFQRKFLLLDVVIWSWWNLNLEIDWLLGNAKWELPTRWGPWWNLKIIMKSLRLWNRKHVHDFEVLSPTDCQDSSISQIFSRADTGAGEDQKICMPGKCWGSGKKPINLVPNTEVTCHWGLEQN